METPLHGGSTVLGVIPHYRCEPWLAQAIESLRGQTRPLDGIVVIDDASTEPPVEIVRRYPHVTLLTSLENVGPYRLIQTIIGRTRYDAYLQQDADDWSTSDRLALLLAEAERTGAELIGSASMNVESGNEDASENLLSHPWDVNAAFSKEPTGWFLSWGTALVSRDLVMRLGGLAGLPCSGDLEFQRRAHHAAKVVNVPQCCYYRRRRPDALTSAPETGRESPLRRGIRKQIRARAIENAAAVAGGRVPDLLPVTVAEPMELRYLIGPVLRELTESVG